LDPEGGSQKATLFVLLLVGISSLAGPKSPIGFLNTQRSAMKLCTHICAHVPHITKLPSQIVRFLT